MTTLKSRKSCGTCQNCQQAPDETQALLLPNFCAAVRDVHASTASCKSIQIGFWNGELGEAATQAHSKPFGNTKQHLVQAACSEMKVNLRTEPRFDCLALLVPVLGQAEC